MSEKRTCPHCHQNAYFERLTDGSVVCNECHAIDTKLTESSNLRDQHQDGGWTIDSLQSQSVVYDNRLTGYRHAAEVNFIHDIENRIIQYLLPSANDMKSILPLSKPEVIDILGDMDSNNGFVKSVLNLYLRMRKHDLDEFERKDKSKGRSMQRRETVESEIRKIKFQLIVAIRMILIENCLILVYGTLGMEGEETIPELCKGKRSSLKDTVQIPTLREMLCNITPSNEYPIPSDEFTYLTKTNTNWTRIFKRPASTFYFQIIHASICLKKLRLIANCPDMKTRKQYLTFESDHKIYKRKWKEVDFEFFKDPILNDPGSYETIMKTTYNLYRASECVGLFQNLGNPSVALALVLWSMYSMIGEIYLYSGAIMAEILCLMDYKDYNASLMRFSDFKKFAIYWSVSLPYANIQVPSLKLPHTGFLGDGLTAYNCDSRRGVPVDEMGVNLIKTVAENWKTIYRTRLKALNKKLEGNGNGLRFGVIDLEPEKWEVECNKAKQMFALSTVEKEGRKLKVPKYSRRAILLTRYEEEKKNGKNVIDIIETVMAEEKEAQAREASSSSISPTAQIPSLDPDEEFERDDYQVYDDPPYPEWYPRVERQKTVDLPPTPETCPSSPFTLHQLLHSEKAEDHVSRMPKEVEERYIAMEKLAQKEKENKFEELLLQGDASSDEDYDGDSSDDDYPIGRSDNMRSKGFISPYSAKTFKDKVSGYGGFTITPHGLVREQLEEASKEDEVVDIRLETDYSAFPMDNHHTPPYSDSFSYPGMTRQRSITVSEGGGSASEAEKIMIPSRTPSTTPPITSSPGVTKMKFKPFNRKAAAIKAKEAARSHRSQSPTVSITTLHSLNSALPRSTAMSRTATTASTSSTVDLEDRRPFIRAKSGNWTPKPTARLNDIDPGKEHIGILLHEREAILPPNAGQLRARGELMTQEIEEYVNNWVNLQIRANKIPKKISVTYLHSIGLKKVTRLEDLRKMDLGEWCKSQEWRWSPLECLLRAGYKTNEIPKYLIPSSKLAVSRQLSTESSVITLPLKAVMPSLDPFGRELEQPFNTRRTNDPKDFDANFPYFFDIHEVLEIGDSDDCLFDEGEMDIYIADDKELTRKKKNKVYMEMIEFDPDKRDEEDGSSQAMSRIRKRAKEKNRSMKCMEERALRLGLGMKTLLGGKHDARSGGEADGDIYAGVIDGAHIGVEGLGEEEQEGVGADEYWPNGQGTIGEDSLKENTNKKKKKTEKTTQVGSEGSKKVKKKRTAETQDEHGSEVQQEQKKKKKKKDQAVNTAE